MVKKGREVKNIELWRKIHEECDKKKSVYAIHVKAHSGITYNEMVTHSLGKRVSFT